MKKKILVTLLTVCMLLALMPVATNAQTNVPKTSDFTDLEADGWYYDYVGYCVTNQLFHGVSPTQFSPSTPITRGAFITVLGRFCNVENDIHAITAFSDVPDGAYYTGYVKWAVDNGITNGTSTTTFEPDGNLTREMLCTLLCRFADYLQYPRAENANNFEFVDHENISTYAVDSIYSCYQDGIVQGKEYKLFFPKDFTTRAEVCTMLKRFVRHFTFQYEETPDPDTPYQINETYSDFFGTFAIGCRTMNENDTLLRYKYTEGDFTQDITYSRDDTSPWVNTLTVQNTNGLNMTKSYVRDENGYPVKIYMNHQDGTKGEVTCSYDDMGHITKLRFEENNLLQYEVEQTYSSTSDTLYISRFQTPDYCYSVHQWDDTTHWPRFASMVFSADNATYYYAYTNTDLKHLPDYARMDFQQHMIELNINYFYKGVTTTGSHGYIDYDTAVNLARQFDEWSSFYLTPYEPFNL